MKKYTWQDRAAITVTLAGGAVAIFLFLKYVLPLLLPFLFALLFAILTRPAVTRITARFRGHEKFIAISVTAFFLCFFLLLTVFVISLVLSEAEGLLSYVLKNAFGEEGSFTKILAFFEGGGEKSAFLTRLEAALPIDKLFENFDVQIRDALQKMLLSWSEQLTRVLAGLAGRLPGAIFFFVVTVIASFFVAVDYEKIKSFFLSHLPEALRERLPRLRAKMLAGARRYLFAYLLLFLLTFGELWLGFLILGEKYSFLLAFLTAFLDILPVLGIGTVLLPWAIFRFVLGNIKGAILLLCLYGILTIVRQIAEPRLVGKSLGLHPLLMLLSFYVGMKLFGFFGIFLGPLSMLAVKSVFFQGGLKIKNR